MDYYNTTHLEGEELINEILNAKGQESKVLSFFMDHPDNSFAPHEIKANVLPHCPITSSRRAITNLTKGAKVLTKTNLQVLGEHGKPVYKWKLRQIYRPVT